VAFYGIRFAGRGGDSHLVQYQIIPEIERFWSNGSWLFSGYIYFIIKFNTYGMISKSSLIRLTVVFLLKMDTQKSLTAMLWCREKLVTVHKFWPNGDIWLKSMVHGSVTIIDCTRLHTEPNYQGIEEVVISAAISRTVLGGYKRLLFTTRQWNIPREEDIVWADLVSIDPQFGHEALLAAEYAQKHLKPILGIDCKLDDPILNFFHVLVIGDPYSSELVWQCGSRCIISQYAETVLWLLIFTRGEKPLWDSRAVSSRHA
jgi:hypothetical protein